MDKHTYLCLEIYIMNKKQFKKSGVFKDILETTKTKSKVEQFINEPEVSEDEIRKEIYDYEEKFDEENIDDQKRLDAHNSLQLAKELYLEQYNKILPTLNLLSENPAGIGDHSTEDFYRNAEEALKMLIDADDRLDALKMYFEQ